MASFVVIYMWSFLRGLPSPKRRATRSLQVYPRGRLAVSFRKCYLTSASNVTTSFCRFPPVLKQCFFFPTFKQDGVNYSVIYRGSIRASNTIWIDSFFKPLQNGRIPDLSLMKAWTRPSWRKMIGSWISQEVLNGWCLGCQYTIFLGSLEDAGWLIPF